MTICLAALCRAPATEGDPVPTVVVAADRMVTLGGFIEFEHELALLEIDYLKLTIAVRSGQSVQETDSASLRDLSPFGR